MATMKVSEVTGELKKLVKMYEAVEHVESLIQVLVEKEAIEKDLNTKIKNAQNLLDVTQSDLGNAHAELEDVKIKISVAKKAHQELIKAHSDERSDVIRAAQVKAQDIEAAANRAKEIADNALVAKNKEIERLNSDIASLVREKNKLVGDIAAEKQKLRDAFGV